MISPDNFFYFITLFTLGVFSVTYLLFTYYINRLLIINLIVLFLATTRVASEYYIQQLSTFEQIQNYAPWHVLPVNLLIPQMWILIIYYVRPLKDWRWEKVTNNFLLYGLIVLPFLGHNYYCSIDPSLYYYSPERIGGYWQFSINSDFWYYSFYQIHIQLTLALLVVILLVGTIRSKKNRVRQSLLFISYLIMPFFYYSMTKQGVWNVPSTGILYLSHSLIISWFVSDYRLFKSNFSLITRNLLESVSDLTISTDPKLNITSFNSKTAATFDISNQNALSWLQERSLEKEEWINQEVNNLINQNIHQREIQLTDKFGNTREFDLKIAPFSNGDFLLGYTFLLTDLSDIKRKEKELEQLNANKNRLFAIIAHDLRNPALSFRQVGKKINYLIKKNDQVKLVRFGHSLEKAAFSLNSLLDNLLNWASKERDGLPYHPRAVNLSAVIEEIIQNLKGLASDKQVLLYAEINADLMVFADSNALLTIVRNLLHNAIKFSHPAGTITIKARAGDHLVHLTITDTGVGIPPERLQTLFDLSTRQSKEGTAGEKGTGLGLHITKELVNINKGQLSVKSQLGEGTSFTMVFPKQK